MVRLPSTTIAAIATPPGDGGIAIIRISGPKALLVGDLIFSKKPSQIASHTVHFGKVICPRLGFIDEALLIVMRAPRSFTGEDIVEIHCHGGHFIAQKVLERALEEGADLAEPGEFSLRAFLNGKIDLAKAEAIQKLIASKNNHALKAARAHLEGKLSQKISSFKAVLTDIGALLEAWVDFPEEGLEFASEEEVIETLNKLVEEMKILLETYREGRIIQEGVHLALIGAPNVGKSSLMNCLLDKERAIVSPVAGTTRDLVEDSFRLKGLQVRLTDTAGIRDAGEAIEQEGIRRSRKVLEEADLVLFVLDQTKGFSDEEKAIYSMTPSKNVLLVWNKSDLGRAEKTSFPSFEQVEVSAKTGEGIEELKRKIDKIIWRGEGPSEEGLILTESRHRLALEDAIEITQSLSLGIEKRTSPEFLTFDLRRALKALNLILGSDIQEEILDAIFSKFCIGK